MRRRRAPQTPALPLSVLDVAVLGWDALASEYDDGDDGFEPFLIRDWAALYRAHRALIDSEARRRGMERPWAATQGTHGY